MITPRKIEEATMSAEKKASAKNDLFAFYVGRPLSYLLTIPFLYTGISPNTISVVSIIPTIIGLIIPMFWHTKLAMVISWVCFFLWNLLDGVDGNVARYKKQFSEMGGVFDATSGYFAMVLSFFAWGIGAYYSDGVLQDFIAIPHEYYVVLGGLSGCSVIFPRLVMHKAINSSKNKEKFNDVKDKSSFSIVKIIALNLTSIAGFVQVLMLIAACFNLMDVFTIGYFLINTLVMVASLRSILNK